ncbi:Hypothetical predicted protein [Mytilus galloprovincialis]|uniref:Uncharacterized protein n=1 Tax=Mytilus galloprovincialis TaxID=29158 RepID=A0A8B6G7D5_MYTGA|nr:Hypothetical predicted protein [Mytilus galloprovincialis]
MSEGKLKKYLKIPLPPIIGKKLLTPDSKGFGLWDQVSTQIELEIRWWCKSARTSQKDFTWLQQNIAQNIERIGNIHLYVWLGTCDLTTMTELTNVSTHPENIDVCNCRRASTVTAPSTIDSSDSLFALSNRNLDSIEILWQSQAVPTLTSHFSDSEIWITSDSKDTEFSSKKQNESFASIIFESKSLSVDEELQLDQHWLKESSNISKSYDDLDSECASDGKHVFSQPLSESGGSCSGNAGTQRDELPAAAGVFSFSDILTQIPDIDGLPSPTLLEISFSDAEMQVPASFVYGLHLSSDEPSFSDDKT